MQIITVISHKADESKHYEWQGMLIEETDDYILILCEPNRKLKHYTKNTEYTFNNWSLEYFSKNEGFTVAMTLERGKIVSYYCNINSKVTYQNHTISYVDYDLDIIKNDELDWEVVDIEDYEENKVKYNYSEYLQKHIFETLYATLNKIMLKEFPFNLTEFEINQ